MCARGGEGGRGIRREIRETREEGGGGGRVFIDCQEGMTEVGKHGRHERGNRAVLPQRAARGVRAFSLVSIAREHIL